MKAFVITEKDKYGMQDIEVPEGGPDEVLMKCFGKQHLPQVTT